MHASEFHGDVLREVHRDGSDLLYQHVREHVQHGVHDDARDL
jgi:hypothetical protein